MTDSETRTLELARVYEEQGYFKKAADHFSGLLKNDPENPVLIQALDRINVNKTDSNDFSSLSGIVEQWVYLVMLRQRVERLAHKSEI